MTDLDEPIHLCDYDPQWPVLFASEARRIAAGLPSPAITRVADVAIEHIGSTAVSGLLSKPIVDLMVGVEPHHDAVSTRLSLVALGYEDMAEAGVPGRIYLRRRVQTAFNIAFVVRGGSIKSGARSTLTIARGGSAGQLHGGSSSVH